MKFCMHCGTTSKGEYAGSLWITLILLCFWIVPGLIYETWRVGKGRNICPNCKRHDMVPANSPRAIKAAAEWK
jgi:hypothetical protein